MEWLLEAFKSWSYSCNNEIEIQGWKRHWVGLFILPWSVNLNRKVDIISGEIPMCERQPQSHGSSRTRPTCWIPPPCSQTLSGEKWSGEVECSEECWEAVFLPLSRVVIPTPPPPPTTCHVLKALSRGLFHPCERMLASCSLVWCWLSRTCRLCWHCYLHSGGTVQAQALWDHGRLPLCPIEMRIAPEHRPGACFSSAYFWVVGKEIGRGFWQDKENNVPEKKMGAMFLLHSNFPKPLEKTHRYLPWFL